MQSSGNSLLVKSDLGKKKPGYYLLPSEAFTYGKSTGEDKEGAGNLLSTWKFHQSSQKLPNEVDYRLLNSMSVVNGLSTATEFRKYRKGKDVRIHTSGPGLRKKPEVPDITYGLPLRNATPIKAVLGNFYGRLAIEDMHNAYAQSPTMKPSKWSSTRGFELLKLSKLKSMGSSQSNLFKMRKFLTARPRTDCWRAKK